MSPIVHTALPQCLQILFPLPQDTSTSTATAAAVIDVSLSEVPVVDPPPAPAVLDLPFLGSVLVSDEMAVAIAEGLIDPSTKVSHYIVIGTAVDTII